MTKTPEIKAIGTFAFDPEKERLTDSSGREITLRPQTLRVLASLAAQAPGLVTKEDLMSEVWADTHVTDDSLVQCVSEIRRALGPREGKLLKTIPKQGYRLEISGGADAPSRSDSRPRFMSVAIALAIVLVLAAAVWAFWPAGPRGPVSIAVLPFDNLSADPDQNYMSVGLAEDLLTDLAQVGELTVLSQSATFALHKGPETLRGLHDTRGVTHVIDGSVQRDGQRLRISVRLVDAETGTSLWAERYDRDLGDIFAVQDDVRSRIFAALAVRLAPGQADLLREARASEVSAYDLLLQGRFLESALTRTGTARALELYKQAIAIDPGYGEAYARLANMYDFAARFGWAENTDDAREMALKSARTAVRLAPRLPYAHWTLGRVTARLGTGPDSVARATAEFHRAIELDPNYADAYGFLALVLIGDGRPDEAKQAIDRAFLLNPEPPSWYAQNRGIVSYFTGDLEAAIADFETATQQNATARAAHQWLAAAYGLADRRDDAEWEIMEANTLVGPVTISEILRANSVIHHQPYREVYAKGLRAAGVPE